MNRFLRWVQAIRRFSLQSIISPLSAILYWVSLLYWILVLFLLFLGRKLFWEWWLGFGERPERVLVVAFLILGVTFFLYRQVGTFVLDPGCACTPEPRPRITGHPTWEDALYYSLSLVSFSSVGYGGWVPEPIGWAQWAGSVESFLGIFSAVFFSVTLAPRIMRIIR